MSNVSNLCIFVNTFPISFYYNELECFILILHLFSTFSCRCGSWRQMTGKQDGYSSIISGQFFWHHIPRDSADVMLINRTCIISNKRPLAQCRSWTLSALASHISMPVHLSEWEVLLMHLASLFWTKIHFLDWKLVWMLFRSFRGSDMRVVLLH